MSDILVDKFIINCDNDGREVLMERQRVLT